MKQKHQYRIKEAGCCTFFVFLDSISESLILAKNTHLLELNVQYNQMNQALGIQALSIRGMPFCEAAKDNYTLISFAIEANHIPSCYRKAIEERVLENREHFEKEIMPNIERLSQYKIPESLVKYLKSQLSHYSEVTLDSYPLLVIAEQQKKLQSMKETENKTTLDPILFSPRTFSKATEQAERVPNKLAGSPKTLTF